MSNDRLDEVTASYHRCRHDKAFVDTFYDLFLAKSPEIAEKFANTDFSVQKRMLRESLLTLLTYNLGIEGAREDVIGLGKRHHKLGIRPELYDMWLDTLCEAIRKHDPQYTPELEKLWRKAMQAPIDLMLSEEATS